MSKNGNENILLNDYHIEKEIDQKMKNEGIIFQRRILSHKKEKENKNTCQKSNNNKKDLSIKLNEQYIKRNKNSIKYNYCNNVPFNLGRPKKSSFIKKSNISINDIPKVSIKKSKYIKTTNISTKNCSPIPTLNKSTKRMIRPNSCRRYKKNINKKSMNLNDLNDYNVLLKGSFSPRISMKKLENGHISPMERSKFYINTNYERPNGLGKNTFNYKKWNKITINNIIDKYGKMIQNKICENQKNNNNGIDKENIRLINNQNKINVNNDGIQEIVIPNINKQKKLRISDIPLNRKKVNTKDNINNNINNNNITTNNVNNSFRYFNQNQTPNNAMSKEEKIDFVGDSVNGLKFEKMIKSPETKNKIKVNDSGFNRYKSSCKKTNSSQKMYTDSMVYQYPESVTEFDIKTQKIQPKEKEKTKFTMNKSLNLKNNKFNLDNPNKDIRRNEYHSFKLNANTEMNEKLIKVKSNKLEDFIKTGDINIFNKREIVINKVKDKDDYAIKENTVEMKNKYDSKEDTFNNNTDLMNEKDKCINNYTFDNKNEMDPEDAEISFRFVGKCNNNIFDNYNTNTNISNNIPKNNFTEEIPNPIHYSLKHKIFTKKKIGGISIKTSNINNNNSNYNYNSEDKSFCNKNNDKRKSIINNNSQNENKENIRNNNILKNNKFNGDYMELAKICVNQEKIISDLVKNVQQLNNKICDKDLCINELNNQLYSIKYDLLNTLQKTNGK